MAAGPDLRSGLLAPRTTAGHVTCSWRLIYINYMTNSQPIELVSQAKSRKVLVVLPEPVDEHLELLLRAARAGGALASRSQLMAALVAIAPTEAPQVTRLVLDYLSLEVPDLRARQPQGRLPPVKYRGRKRR